MGVEDDFEKNYVDEEESFEPLDYNNEEDLTAISIHEETLIFNRSDGTWYSREYATSEIAKKVYDLEMTRFEQ